jgi:hypothetical protein
MDPPVATSTAPVTTTVVSAITARRTARVSAPRRTRKRQSYGSAVRQPAPSSSHSSGTNLSTEPPRRSLTFVELYQQVRIHPHDSTMAIADHLATRYAWTPTEKEQHYRRLQDIKASIMFTRLDELTEIPLIRTPASLEAYFASTEARINEARLFRNTLDCE